MDNQDVNKIMELIDSVKMYSGCDEVALIGSNRSFEELVASGFPLGDFKYGKAPDGCDESMLYVIPCGNKEIKMRFER